MVLSPGTRLGVYTIVAPLGHGGMGVVYRARDARLGREVAIKLLPDQLATDPDRRARFEREARLLASLNHPNIVTIYSVEEANGIPFLTMELVDGCPLSDLVSPGGMPVPDLLRLAVQLADALAAAHERGVVHRDVKPANVVVAKGGRVKVLDFGLAKSRPLSTSDDLMTMSGEATVTAPAEVLGTLPYMSPEQVQGLPVDHRSDIFSLGVLFYELVTGRRPFAGGSGIAVLSSILRDMPPPVSRIRSGVPATLVRVIDRCLEKNPSDRYQAAGDLRRDLEEIAISSVDPQRDGQAGVGPVPQSDRSRRASRRRVAGAVAGTILVALLLWVILGPSGLRERWQAGGTGPSIGSIAVLPLENISGDPEGEMFTDGVTDAIITDLAKISALRVVSRTSVMRYRKTQKSIPEIAREMSVDAVVEGSVERVGDRVRVSAQLIRASTDRHLWADSYERQLSDVLSLQDEVARTIAKAVQVTLTPEEAARLATARRVDPEAYSLYLKGRYFWNKRTEENVNKAIDYFRQALDRDPNYAPAYAGLADCYSSLGFSYDVGKLAPAEAIAKARQAALKALSLDDSDAGAHNSLASIKMDYDWDWPGAEAEFRRALALNPGSADAHHWYAHMLLSAGRIEEGLRESRKALDLDQLNPIINAHLGWYYDFSGQYDKAVPYLEKLVDTDPGNPDAWWYLGLAYEGQHRYGQAIERLSRATKMLNGEFVTVADLGHAYALAGRTAEARAIIAKLEEVAQHRYVSPFNVAMIYLALGDRTKALDYFERAFRARSEMLIYSRVDPRLAVIRDDPRFKSLIERVGIPAGRGH